MNEWKEEWKQNKNVHAKKSQYARIDAIDFARN